MDQIISGLKASTRFGVAFLAAVGLAACGGADTGEMAEPEASAPAAPAAQPSAPQDDSVRYVADRIIVGEVRGKESFDMLQAMNTGHDGSLTTIHANSARDALHRLETLMRRSVALQAIFLEV